MISRKGAKRYLKQYGKHIKDCESRTGSVISLGRLGAEDYNDLVKSSKKNPNI